MLVDIMFVGTLKRLLIHTLKTINLCLDYFDSSVWSFMCKLSLMVLL